MATAVKAQAAPQVKPQPTRRKFRLLAGSHLETDPDFVNLTLDELARRAAEKGIEVDPLWSKATARSELLRRLGAERMYNAGDLIEQEVTAKYCPACRVKYEVGQVKCLRSDCGGELTDATLEVMFGRDKFQLLDEAREVVREVEVIKDRPVFLDAMSLQELRDYAETHEIDLPEGADSKQKVSAAIMAAQQR